MDKRTQLEQLFSLGYAIADDFVASTDVGDPPCLAHWALTGIQVDFGTTTAGPLPETFDLRDARIVFSFIHDSDGQLDYTLVGPGLIRYVMEPDELPSDFVSDISFQIWERLESDPTALQMEGGSILTLVE
jgi:hypothetical protein